MVLPFLFRPDCSQALRTVRQAFSRTDVEGRAMMPHFSEQGDRRLVESHRQPHTETHWAKQRSANKVSQELTLSTGAIFYTHMYTTRYVFILRRTCLRKMRSRARVGGLCFTIRPLWRWRPTAIFRLRRSVVPYSSLILLFTRVVRLTSEDTWLVYVVRARIETTNTVINSTTVLCRAGDVIPGTRQ